MHNNQIFQVNARKTERGFTLVELMVSLLLFGLVMGGVFAAYRTQQRTQTAQDAVAEMQQNIRAAMLLMSRDIREARCDPTLSSVPNIMLANVGQIQFTRDIAGNLANPNQGDGDVDDPNENVGFGFSSVDDADSNGQPDGGLAVDFGRYTAGIFQPIASNIERVEFNYILDDGTRLTNPTFSQIQRIDSVQVTLLARASRIDPDFRGNNVTFVTGANNNWGPYNDSFRRTIEIMTIHIRNG